MMKSMRLSLNCRSYVAVGITMMAEDLDYEQAQLAYSIIERLIEHTRVLSDLVAMMAQVLDEDTTKALTQTPTWTAYLDSRRALEKTKADVERFAEALKELDAD
jgi:hypothetical protein